MACPMTPAGPPRPRDLWRPPRALLSAPWAPVAVLVSLLIASGVTLRFCDFGFPSEFLFDEHHFVPNARNYLSGRPDTNDHPPLGKLLIAASIRLVGDGPVGWRLPAGLFGLSTIVLGGLSASRLFKSQGAGWLAAALLSADGFLISYSRVGLLDGYITAAAAGALLVASTRWRAGSAPLGGVLVGLASGVKFSGGGVAFPLLAATLLSPQPRRAKWRDIATMFAVAAFVYVSQYAVGLHLAGRPASVGAVVADTVRLVRHHAELTAMKNPATSGWPTWVLPVRPLVMGYFTSIGSVRVLSCLGNLAIWWPAILLALATGARTIWRGVEATASGVPAQSQPSFLDAFLAAHGRAVLVTLSAAAGFLAPWVLTHRDSYIYHFLPTYTMLVILLAGFVDWSRAAHPLAVTVFMVVVLLVLAYYAPVWALLPIRDEGMRTRLFLESWR